MQQQEVDPRQIEIEKKAIKLQEEQDEKDGITFTQSLLFGVGQPLQVYRDNADFSQSRFANYSSDWMLWAKILVLIPSLYWTHLCWYSMSGDFIYFTYFWTYWSWLFTVLSQILSIAAHLRPDYWKVTAFAFLEATHGLNMFETVLFWCFLSYGFYAPLDWSTFWTWSQYETFMVAHMTILHIVPICVTTFNIYLTDIRIQKNDWWIILYMNSVYIIFNYIGVYDYGYIYPIIDWKSTPETLAIFCIAITGMVYFYWWFAQWAEKLPRRSESDA